MFLLFKRLDLRLHVLFVDSSLASISVDVCELVDGDGVLFIQGGAVEGFYDGGGFFCGVEFEKREPINLSVEAAGSEVGLRLLLPFTLSFFSHGHVYALLCLCHAV